jgi:hypothetical protein
MVDPLHHLVRTEALLAEFIGEETLQALAIEVEQVLLGGCFGHWASEVKSVCHGLRGSRHIHADGAKNGWRGKRLSLPILLVLDPQDPRESVAENQRT